MYTFAPNDLNYANCSRCFYLKKKLQIEIKGNFQSIFNAFVKFSIDSLYFPSPILDNPVR